MQGFRIVDEITDQFTAAGVAMIAGAGLMIVRVR